MHATLSVVCFVNAISCVSHLDFLIEFDHAHGACILYEGYHIHQVFRGLWLLQGTLGDVTELITHTDTCTGTHISHHVHLTMYKEAHLL